MCLAVPHILEKVFPDGRAIAVTGAVRTEIRTDLIDDPAPGDTVLVHAGFAIEKLDPGDSGELLHLWEELRRVTGEDYVS